MTERFNKFFKELLENEGGYVDDPHDSGGKTLWGITINNFPKAYKLVKELYDKGQIELAKTEAKLFYYKNFYNPLYDEIENEQLAFRVMDFGVNGGVKRAVKILQKTINQFGFKLVDDGVFGQGTLKAVNEIGQPLYPAYVIQLENYYRSLSTFWKFGKGWLRRLRRLLPILLFLFIGCSSAPIITETKEEITVQVPEIKAKEIPVEPVNLDYEKIIESFTDSSELKIEVETETGKGEVKITKGYSKKGKPELKADFKAKPNDIKKDIPVQHVTPQKGFWEKLGDNIRVIIIVAFVIFIAGYVIYFFKKT